MKYFFTILSFAILIAIGVGFYFKNSGDDLTGDKIVGLAVLATVFILMPVFLYHRWKGKRLEDYTLSEKNMKKMNDRRND